MQKGVGQLTLQRISEAIFLIGFGAVWILDLWWPGLLIAFGVSWSTSLVLRRKYWATSVVVMLLCVAPAAYLLQPTSGSLVPVLVVGVGIVGLARAVYLRRETE